jgi:RNA polymerase sigma-70 factor (ECF subfamily)
VLDSPSPSASLPLPPATSLFARTRWSLVQRAAGGADTALGEWLRLYWYPLYAWARRRGLSAEDASDRVQGFFEKVCARNLLDRADETRGRLRSWLLKSFTNHLADEAQRARREKRGGGAAHLALDWPAAEAAYLAEPALCIDPDALYARTWALSLLEEALDQVGAHYAATGRAEVFAALLPALDGPLPETTYEEVAASLAMSPAALRQAAVRLRARYRRALLDLAAMRLGITSEAQLEDELRTLLG